MMAATPLESALAAVPDEIKTVRKWGPGQITTEAERCADLISQAGIVLWWDEKSREKQRRNAGRSLLKGDGDEINPDDVIAALTRGLAILAIRPLGVEFAGLHLCDHPDSFGCEPGVLAVSAQPVDGDIARRGAFWTPRALAEEVVRHALEAAVYDPGPLHTADEGEWKLLPAMAILSKHVSDISVGAGVFPVAALRYLTARILDHADSGNITPALEQYVRAQVITHCLYGADIDPASIELCRVVIALMVPLVDIDVEISRRFRHGDSLLGIEDIDQLRYWDFDVQRGRTIHGSPVIDVNALAAAGGVEALWLLADLLSGAMLATAGKNKKAARRHVMAETERLAVRVAAGDPSAIKTARLRARELLDSDLPIGRPSRSAFHWPLAFPEVFGATRASIGSGVAGGEVQ